jgi:hypothetical protein
LLPRAVRYKITASCKKVKSKYPNILGDKSRAWAFEKVWNLLSLADNIIEA